jgi:hypothetical protein
MTDVDATIVRPTSALAIGAEVVDEHSRLCRVEGIHDGLGSAGFEGSTCHAGSSGRPATQASKRRRGPRGLGRAEHAEVVQESQEPFRTRLSQKIHISTKGFPQGTNCVQAPPLD